MKLMAGRQYKNDFSDIVGILIEQDERADMLTLKRIKMAINELYGSYECIPENSREFIESIFEKNDLRSFYVQCRNMEVENKDILVEFEDKYPGVLNGGNLADVLKTAKTKKMEKNNSEKGKIV